MALKEALDGVLRQAADSGEVPGVVAMITNRDGTLYEGAFGKRSLDGAAPMTLDTVGLIASMTKAITSVAVMQLIERGQLDLDSPASRWLPELDKAQVLEGFDAAGKPKLRAPKRAITLKHLLTHTSGFAYEFVSEDIQKYQAATNTPGFISCALDSIRLPLLFDPGERWSYGVSTDWAGRIVEAVSGQKLGEYFAQHILGPLGMKDTTFRMRADMRERLAKIHARVDGKLVPIDLEVPQQPEFEMGGGGLYGTMGDYLKFVRMVLNRGSAQGHQLLKPETVDLMMQNHLGELDVPTVRSANRQFTNDMPMPPDNPQKWGLAWMINSKALPTGRPAGSLMWAGLANSYYWIDPTSGIAGVLMTQILPFADVKAMPLFLNFEFATYKNL
ncbi:MAG TPA: serine hydrolase domain-containing protein [Fontimonas sp.]